jgi:hypothetical protein
MIGSFSPQVPTTLYGYCTPVILLDLLENLIQRRFLSSGGGVPWLGLTSACVAALRAVLMGGGPDIPHIHIPGAIPEFANLADLHPVPTLPHRDFRVRVNPDAFAALLQDYMFSWTDRPFTQPVLIV